MKEQVLQFTEQEVAERPPHLWQFSWRILTERFWHFFQTFNSYLLQNKREFQALTWDVLNYSLSARRMFPLCPCWAVVPAEVCGRSQLCSRLFYTCPMTPLISLGHTSKCSSCGLHRSDITKLSSSSCKNQVTEPIKDFNISSGEG